MFRRIAIVAGIVAVLMLSATPIVEATTPVADREPASTLDEPRHIPTVKPYGPYRLILPKPSRITATITTDEPPSPTWTNNIYVIKAGDTLSKLTPFLKHSVAELAHCSGIANPNQISIGQKIHKPGNCVAPPVVEPAPVPGNDLDHTIAPASGIVETVIAFAQAQLGDPYVWAANGPDAWDCSGLVHAAFKYAGISTTRSTKTLINEGTSVGRSAMVRGDLIFTSKGHVGVYLGNNQLIHAPQSGDVVKISTVWSFYAARRIA